MQQVDVQRKQHLSEENTFFSHLKHVAKEVSYNPCPAQMALPNLKYLEDKVSAEEGQREKDVPRLVIEDGTGGL